MSMNISRRRLLGAAGAAAALAAAGRGLLPSAYADAPRHHLSAASRVIDIRGRAATVWGLRRPDGGNGLELMPGERFHLALRNRMDEPTIIHWHGLTPPPDQDGVTDTGYAGLIPPDGQAIYDFAARPGTHWMHSHAGLQEQRLLAAPLIVRSAADLAADRQEVVVMLHDFSFRTPDEILAGLTGMAAAGHGGMNHGTMTHGAMNHGNMGQAVAGPDLNDVDYDAFLAEDRTLDDPLVVRTERRGRVRLRVINAATATAFRLDLGGHPVRVAAVDGNEVPPQEAVDIPLAQGQRVDLLVDMPAEGGVVPLLATREGDTIRTGILLATPGAAVARISDRAARPAAPVDAMLDRILMPADAAVVRPARRVEMVLDGGMMPYRWTIDGRSWADHRPVQVRAGEVLAVTMVNRSTMAHPMHLHGHHFRVTAIDGRPVGGILRDTVQVVPGSAVTIAVTADNPGRWLFHCHSLYHMATGMMTELVYV
ncbi:multicopper oxidase family protein [uncultured Tistrella sp.]|uniref:multicopper oxidase family protein n=1 Tax=Tistrella mobilis TaxID=171437 RepID=UPI002601806F|nr:multicopper oxidase family protein [uncultured Tistrella sp.]